MSILIQPDSLLDMLAHRIALEATPAPVRLELPWRPGVVSASALTLHDASGAPRGDLYCGVLDDERAILGIRIDAKLYLPTRHLAQQASHHPLSVCALELPVRSGQPAYPVLIHPLLAAGRGVVDQLGVLLFEPLELFGKLKGCTLERLDDGFDAHSSFWTYGVVFTSKKKWFGRAKSADINADVIKMLMRLHQAATVMLTPDPEALAPLHGGVHLGQFWRDSLTLPPGVSSSTKVLIEREAFRLERAYFTTPAHMSTGLQAVMPLSVKREVLGCLMETSIADQLAGGMGAMLQPGTAAPTIPSNARAPTLHAACQHDFISFEVKQKRDYEFEFAYALCRAQASREDRATHNVGEMMTLLFGIIFKTLSDQMLGSLVAMLTLDVSELMGLPHPALAEQGPHQWALIARTASGFVTLEPARVRHALKQGLSLPEGMNLLILSHGTHPLMDRVMHVMHTALTESSGQLDVSWLELTWRECFTQTAAPRATWMRQSWPLVRTRLARWCEHDGVHARRLLHFIVLPNSYHDEYRTRRAGQDARQVLDTKRGHVLRMLELAPGHAPEHWEILLVYRLLERIAGDDTQRIDPRVMTPWLSRAILQLEELELEHVNTIIEQAPDPDLLRHMDQVIQSHPDEARRAFLAKEQKQIMKVLSTTHEALIAQMRGRLEVSRAPQSAGGISMHRGDGTHDAP